jgi:hypothetical protein
VTATAALVETTEVLGQAPAAAARRRGVAGLAAVSAGLALVSAAIVVATRVRPAYDGYGWLVWGHQTLHLNLDTNGAPSWKPLTVLFTLPYALAGHGQLWLWSLTAVCGALWSVVMTARLAYRLTGPSPERHYAPVAAAAVAAVGIVGTAHWWHYFLIADSDPMVVALLLAAVELQLVRRRGPAYACLILAALGRPEVWPFVCVYVLWAWRAAPRTRLWAILGALLVPLLWFGVSALTSHDWLEPGFQALYASTAIHGAKIPGVLHRFASMCGLLYEIPAAAMLGFAIVRRERVLVTLAGAAVVWLVVEIGFAFHGWPAVQRYMLEPAAVLVLLAAVGVGRVLAAAPSWLAPVRRAIRPPVRPAALALASVLVAPVLALLLAAVVPWTLARVSMTRSDLRAARVQARRLDGLHHAIAVAGGSPAILACGSPVTTVLYESAVAWELGLNVNRVGFDPAATAFGTPSVLIVPNARGWSIQPVNVASAMDERCSGLSRDVPDS